MQRYETISSHQRTSAGRARVAAILDMARKNSLNLKCLNCKGNIDSVSCCERKGLVDGGGECWHDDGIITIWDEAIL